MADVRFSQASNAYQDALRAAERIVRQAESQEAPAASGTSSSGGPSFVDLVGGALNSAQQAGYHSEAIADKALNGNTSMADVITAVAGAENALATVVAVRDKVIGAYQDIIRMPI